MKKVGPSYIKRLIAEERALQDEQQRFGEIILRESARLKSAGYPREIINEGLIEMVANLPDATIQAFKKYVAMKVLVGLGFQKTSILTDLIAEVVENIHILEFKRYMSRDGCDDLTVVFTAALSEVATNPLIDSVMANLGVNPTTGIYSTLKEAVTTTLQEGTLFQTLARHVAGAICGLDVTGAVEALTASASGGRSGAP